MNAYISTNIDTIINALQRKNIVIGFNNVIIKDLNIAISLNRALRVDHIMNSDLEMVSASDLDSDVVRVINKALLNMFYTNAFEGVDNKCTIGNAVALLGGKLKGLKKINFVGLDFTDDKEKTEFYAFISNMELTQSLLSVKDLLQSIDENLDYNKVMRLILKNAFVGQDVLEAFRQSK